MFIIRNMKQDDVSKCAGIVMEIYNNNILNEGWTEETSNAFVGFVFKIQPDLCFVAETDGDVIGFAIGFIKPWSNGNILMEEELSVKEKYRRKGVAKELMKETLKTVIEKYNIVSMCGTTYNEENEMPYSWYKRIGFIKSDELYIIEGEPKTILEKL